MKKVLFFLTVFMFLGIMSPSFVSADTLINVNTYHSDITVNKDASSNVKEVINVQLQNGAHGIYWEYPYEYDVKGFRRPTTFNLKSACYYPEGNNSKKKCGNYELTRSNGWATLKIGEAETTLKGGNYVYEISYDLKFIGVSYFDDHDEFYYNIVGPGWPVSIDSVTATITLPGQINDFVCYTGKDGEKGTDCAYSVDTNSVTVSTVKTLGSYEGLTIASSMPKGTFDDTTAEQLRFIIMGNLLLFLPIPVGIILWGILKKRWANKKLTIIPHYEPDPTMDPVSAGIIYSGKGNFKYITAGLIYLAVNGYLKIRKNSNTNYELEKVEKSFANNIPLHLTSLYNSVFVHGEVVPFSKLTNFASMSSKALLGARKNLSNLGYFSVALSGKRTFIYLIAILFGLVSIVGAPYFFTNVLVGTFLGFLISSILLFIFAATLDIRSPLGNEKYHELLGLKMYINTAEKNRIEFHNDPVKYSNVFEQLLPYAMIFGLEKKWAKEFEDIYTQQPDWYQGNFNSFNAYHLSRSIGTLNTKVSTISSPSYGSSSGHRSSGWSSGGSGFGGGGSSGGGGGGSGGGGW